MTEPRIPSVTIEIERTWNGEAIPARESVRVEMESGASEWIVRVDAPYHGDPRPAAAVGSTDGLWDHEVVELFLLADHERYLEVELGPHGHYLVLVLKGPREREETGLAIDYVAKRVGDRWTGQARIPKAYLLGDPHAFNAYAMHGEGAARRYLAAAPVAGATPDFHRLECFLPLRLS